MDTVAKIKEGKYTALAAEIDILLKNFENMLNNPSKLSDNKTAIQNIEEYSNNSEIQMLKEQLLNASVK